ncbi:MAG: response regulator [Gammaproteobacteria bacterium]
MTKDSVLVVDDDREIRTLLCDYLEQNDFRAHAVPNGKAMWTALESSRVDLVVLDLMLPGEDGLALCREIRARMDTPVIMLTARGEEIDRIIGLEMGADDYLPKPFNPRELLARVKSVLRRSRSLPRNLQPDDARLIRFAGWTLDPALRQLTSGDGVVVPLGGAEYRLLRILLNHANRVVSRDQIMDLTKGRETDPLERSIDAQVSRLRQRLRDDPREPAIIQTVRGEGYMLCARVDVLR